jgi:hypothetical protein
MWTTVATVLSNAGISRSWNGEDAAFVQRDRYRCGTLEQHRVQLPTIGKVVPLWLDHHRSISFAPCLNLGLYR